MDKRYRVFNRYIELMFDDVNHAKRAASLNAACVYDIDGDEFVADYRTEESENDERG